MDILKSIFTVCFTILIQSCSIKEDRGPCPCHLNVDIESCSGFTDRIMLSAWGNGHENLFTDKIRLGDYSGTYTRKVSKGYLYVCAFSGYDRMITRNGYLLIQEGEECPEVMSFNGEMLDATGESADEHVSLHKQYSTIFLLTDELTENTGDLQFRVTGNVNGFDIATSDPCKGKFHATVARDVNGVRSIRVPRQTDDDLELEIYINGLLYGTKGIGKDIRESGYSWEEEDLFDIYLTVNLFSSSGIETNIIGWDTERVHYTI